MGVVMNALLTPPKFLLPLPMSLVCSPRVHAQPPLQPPPHPAIALTPTPLHKRLRTRPPPLLTSRMVTQGAGRRGREGWRSARRRKVLVGKEGWKGVAREGERVAKVERVVREEGSPCPVLVHRDSSWRTWGLGGKRGRSHTHKTPPSHTVAVTSVMPKTSSGTVAAAPADPASLAAASPVASNATTTVSTLSLYNLCSFILFEGNCIYT